MKQYKNIDSYIRDYPKKTQVLLKKMRAVIKKAAPRASEAIKYGIPTYVGNGNIVHFGGFKTHIGFFPGGTARSIFKKELAKYEGGKGTVQFPLDKPIPWGLVTKIVKYGVARDAARAKKKS